jgi:hypothetical protein
LTRTFTAKGGDKFSLSWSRGDPTCSLSILMKAQAKQKTGLNEDQVVEEVSDLVSQLGMQREPAISFARELEREMKEWWKEQAKDHFLILWDTKYDEPALHDYGYYESRDKKRFITKTDKDEVTRVLGLAWLLKKARVCSTATMFEDNFERILRSELDSIFKSREGSTVAMFAEGSSEPILMKILEVGKDRVLVKRHGLEGVVSEPRLVTRNLTWLLSRVGFVSGRIRLLWYLARYNKIVQHNLD